MIGGISYASSQIASAYNNNQQQLADTLTRIASGKKFQSAAEDLTGYLRAQNIQSDISDYEDVRENLTNFKTYSSAALQTATSVYEKLVQMKDYATKYAAAAAGSDEQAEHKSNFDALKMEVGKILDNAAVNGDDLTQTGAANVITSANLGPGGGSLDMTFTAVAVEGTITAFDLAAPTSTTAANVQTQIDNALSYLSEAKAYDGIADQQLKLTDTIINSKKAVSSLITDIDEAEETNKAIDQSIRSQAAMSMMAQANMSRQAVLKLYM